MRAAFFLLLLANLAFLAWSGWIDVPQPAPPNEAYAKLPRLKLVGEQPAQDTPPSSGDARKTALREPPVQASRCFSIGPFDDQAAATQGAAKLRDQGLSPRQRSATGEISKGFWVYIGGLKSDGEVARVLRVLEQSHIEDAHAMPDGGDDRRVSVGVFSERERADKRANSLQKLDLHPEVAPRMQPATVYWMDVNVPPGAAAPAVKDFSGGPDMGTGGRSQIEAIPCPESLRPAAAPLAPAPGTAPFRTKVAGASKVP